MSSTKQTIIRLTGDINYCGPVGPFVDELLKKRKDEVLIFRKNHSILNLHNENIQIVGVANNEKTSWNSILQITRHPANGGLVKVYTKSGRTTTATLSHSFLKRTNNGITTLKGSDLKLGDRIPIARFIPIVKEPTEELKIGEHNIKLDKKFGWICGAFLADGRIDGREIKVSKILVEFENNIRDFCKIINENVIIKTKQGEYGLSKTIIFKDKGFATFFKDNFGNGSYNNKIPAFVFSANLDFIKGLISGYFDGDGNINSQKYMIRCASRSEELIEGMSILLTYCGIFCSKLKEKSIRQPNKVSHTLSVQKKYAKDFKDKIGFDVKEKEQELDKIIAYNNRKDKQSDQDTIDQIPELMGTLREISSLLGLPKHNFAPSIGRRTLQTYIQLFKRENSTMSKNIQQQANNLLKILEQAANSDVVWDKIVKLEYLDDPKEYVYDFTVPGNDSFMVDCGVLVHNTLNTLLNRVPKWIYIIC